MTRDVYETLSVDGVYRLTGLPDSKTSVLDSSFWLDFCALDKALKEEHFAGVQQHKGLLYREAYTDAGTYRGELFDLWSHDGSIETAFRPGPAVPAGINAFYEHLMAFHDLTNELVADLLAALRTGLPSVDELCKKEPHKLLIRLLHYVPPPDEDLLTHHVDRGLISFHLFETQPQFQIWKEDSWQDVDMIPGVPAAFCGGQMEKVTGGILTGMEHRVIRRGDWRERYSAVAFVWFPNL